MAFVDSSTKAGWLSFKALWKPFKKRVNRNNTKFRDKIAFVGGPSFRRRPWPFVDRRSRGPSTSATLVSYMPDGKIEPGFLLYFNNKKRIFFYMLFPQWNADFGVSDDGRVNLTPHLSKWPIKLSTNDKRCTFCCPVDICIFSTLKVSYWKR